MGGTMTGRYVQCRLCPRDDCSVDWSGYDSPLIALYHHGVEEHGLPPDPEPWTYEMIKEAKHENA